MPFDIAAQGAHVLLAVGNGVRVCNARTLATVNTFSKHAARVMHVGVVGQKVVSVDVDGVAHVWSQDSSLATEETALGEIGVAVSSGLDGGAVTSLKARQTDPEAQSHKEGEAVVVFTRRDPEGSVEIVAASVGKGSTKAATVIQKDVTAYLLGASSPTLHTIAYSAGSSAHVVCLGWAPGDFYRHRSGLKYTAIGVHPYDPTVCLGTETGRMYVAYLDRSASPSRGGPSVLKELHYHPFQVRSLQWSPDASALLSGGDHSSIALWNARSWRNRAVHRFPGPVLAGAWTDDGASAVFGCAPSTLAAVDPGSLSITALVHAADLLMGQPCCGVVAAGPARPTLVAATGLPGHVHFYDAWSHVAVNTVITAPGETRFVGLGTESLPVLTTRLVAFSKDGQYMATVETADFSLGMRTEPESLRFWVNAMGTWTLATVVPNPHDEGCGAVAFRTGDSHVVTIGSEGKLKFWSYTPGGLKHSATAQLPETARLANRKQNQNVGCLCQSPDGSVVIASAGPAALIAAVSPFQEIGVLSQHVTARHALQELSFASPSQAATPFVAGIAHEFYFLWELTSQTLTYVVALGGLVKAIAPLPQTIALSLPDGKGADGAVLAVVSGAFQDKGERSARTGMWLVFGCRESVPIELDTITSGRGVGYPGMAILGGPSGGWRVAFGDHAGILRCLSPAALGPRMAKLFGVADTTIDSKAASVVRRKPRALEELFGKYEGAREKDEGFSGSVARNPVAVCTTLQEFYGGHGAHTLQPPAATLAPLLESLLSIDR